MPRNGELKKVETQKGEIEHMAVTDPTVDPMTYLKEAMNRKPESTGDFTARPFFFAIEENEKALIRPLLNLIHYVRVTKHEAFDNTVGKYIFRCQCAKDLGQECQACLDVEAMPEGTKEEKKLKNQARASERFVLPIYLHAIKNVITGKQSMYTNQDNQELPKSGPRLLEMKPQYSEILSVLTTTFSIGGDITIRDFTIEQQGVKLNKKYITEPRPEPSPFDPASHDIPLEYIDRDLVFSIYSDACPPRIVGAEPVVAQPKATNGAIKNAPDF